MGLGSTSAAEVRFRLRLASETSWLRHASTAEVEEGLTQVAQAGDGGVSGSAAASQRIWRC